MDTSGLSSQISEWSPWITFGLDAAYAFAAALAILVVLCVFAQMHAEHHPSSHKRKPTPAH